MNARRARTVARWAFAPIEILVLSPIVAVLVVTNCSRAAESPEEVRTRFVRDYHSNVNERLDTYTNYEVNSRSYTFRNGEKCWGQPVLTIVTPVGWKTTSTYAEGAGTMKKGVRARNKDYGFFALEQGNGFVVGEKPATYGKIGRPCSHAYWDSETGRTYLDIALDSNFTPVSYTDTQIQGKDCKALCITIIRRIPRDGEPQTLDKVFYFNPNFDWVCVGWRIPGLGMSTMEQRYTYRWVDGFRAAAPAASSLWSIEKDGAAQCIEGIEFEDFRPISIPPPESEFRLTSIGLSEPDNPRKPNSWWNWWLIGAGGLVALVTTVWYFRPRAGKVATA